VCDNKLKTTNSLSDCPSGTSHRVEAAMALQAMSLPREARSIDLEPAVMLTKIWHPRTRTWCPRPWTNIKPNT